MPATYCTLPGLPGYRGTDSYAALPGYAAALHRLAGLAGPPYDPLRMAGALGIRVRLAPTYQGARGLLVPLRDGSYQIIARADETGGAQRFTVAHELVELGLQVGCPSLVERSYHDAGAGQAKERFCEAGAAEILMPLARLRHELEGRPGGIVALRDLATLFGTSLHAMLWRMVEAATLPCMGMILHQSAPASVTRRGLHPARPAASAWSGDSASTAPPAGLVVRTACGGGGLRAPMLAGTAVPEDSVLALCHRDRIDLRATEVLALGRLQGRFRVEATCPGRGERRHVYALLYPC
jgi:hypothetical protein